MQCGNRCPTLGSPGNTPSHKRTKPKPTIAPVVSRGFQVHAKNGWFILKIAFCICAGRSISACGHSDCVRINRVPLSETSARLGRNDMFSVLFKKVCTHALSLSSKLDMTFPTANLPSSNLFENIQEGLSIPERINLSHERAKAFALKYSMYKECCCPLYPAKVEVP